MMLTVIQLNVLNCDQSMVLIAQSTYWFNAFFLCVVKYPSATWCPESKVAFVESHITSFLFGFQTEFPPTVLTQRKANPGQARSPSSIWTHVAICFSLHCAHPAWGLITFAQSRGLSPSPLLSDLLSDACLEWILYLWSAGVCYEHRWSKVLKV